MSKKCRCPGQKDAHTKACQLKNNVTSGVKDGFEDATPVGSSGSTNGGGGIADWLTGCSVDLVVLATVTFTGVSLALRRRRT